MNYEEILEDIKSRRFSPIYFLSGEEPYFIDEITSLLENNILTDDEKEFNQTVLYGIDTTISDIVETARRFPMMSEYQVVIVKEAQLLKSFDSLQSYLSHIQHKTILVIAYKGKTDKRLAVFKAMSKSPDCVMFESAKIKDWTLPSWITSYCKSKGFSIQPESAQLLSDSLGNDLSKIANEISKLSIILPKGSLISDEAIEKHIGISKEFSPFELIKAMCVNDFLKANRIVNFIENNKKITVIGTLAPMYYFFKNLLTYEYMKKDGESDSNISSVIKVAPFIITKEYMPASKRFSAGKCVNIMSLIKDSDLRSKGAANLAIPQGEILRELVFKIMH